MYLVMLDSHCGHVVHHIRLYSKLLVLCYIADEEYLVLAKLAGEVITIYSDEEMEVIEKSGHSDVYRSLLELDFFKYLLEASEGMGDDLYLSYRDLGK